MTKTVYAFLSFPCFIAIFRNLIELMTVKIFGEEYNLGSSSFCNSQASCFFLPLCHLGREMKFEIPTDNNLLVAVVG
jgi:hypothetical protein